MANSTLQEIQPGRAVLLPAVLPHLWCFAVSISAVAISVDIEILWLARFLLVFGLLSGVGFVWVLWKEVLAQDDLLAAHLARHKAVTDSINAEAKPGSQEQSAKPVVQFAPPSFVEFIWSHMHEDGSFPTISECVQGIPCKPNKAQEWYTNIKNAGYMDGRIPFQQSGKPVLTEERFLQAAKDYMTLGGR